ncbi:Histidine kinase [Frankia canadensis]|uniref:histidine kinase n=1 Tax=Frankia canadensis TaxID=1836972 RepID=A0A2I2KK07_9ACTN|nr:nitrate- and nitrite sensing domain-containing protein [Frankia canadensis]SNQ45986.1 Histidine kinase [Frankia canadensis]SOU53276.1 Histidine kinase [Frankia canadensis]
MLQNWPIRSKLVVILVVPLAALAVLSAIQVRGNVDNVRAANRIKALANFSIKANDLVAALQAERYATNSYAGSNYMAVAQGQVAVAARGPVDQALATYRAGEAALPSGARDTLATTLAAIANRLDRLPAQRKALDVHQAQVDDNNSYFNDLVSDLLSLNGSVAAGSHNAALVNGATTLVGISQAKEQAAQQRGAVARVIILRQTDTVTLRQIQSAAGAEDAWLQQFRTTATPDEQSFYNVTVGRTISAATAMRDDTVNAVANGQPLTITQQDWLRTVDAKITAMRQVEHRIATDLGTTSEDISSSASRDALFGSIGVALVLVVSLVISLLVASPMIRHLRRLRQGALEVANESLPGVVERLHRGEQVDMSAETFPVDVQSTDEIGQLAEAFSTVHAVAVRTAVEQAAMRKSIGDTFLNLARRSQALIHRQLKIIDGLERKETDPDELEELFRLDHLATRMRRHAEDLIVLSGSKPARGWRRPVAIKDVVRGAVAEVEDYTRVKVMPIDGGAISGHAVGDVIHMLAELIENATSFSPPHTPVQVSGHEVSNGFVIEVEDRGLGMSPEEFHGLNERLANPPPFDLSTSERLGLFVVGRLAERHAVSVRLRPSPYGGTMAIVLVPATLLRQPEEEGQDSGTSGGATVRALPAPAVPALDGPVLDEDGFSDPYADTGEYGDEFSPDDGMPARTGPLPLGAAGGDAARDDQRELFPDPQRGQDETLIDDLPVFATVRSSWFVADRPRRRAGGRRSDAPARTDDAEPTSGPAGEAAGGALPELPSRRGRRGRSAPPPAVDIPSGPADGTGPVDPLGGPPGADPRAVNGFGAAPVERTAFDTGGYPQGGPGQPAAPFGYPPAGRDVSAHTGGGSVRGGEVARMDPLTSPLRRGTGPRRGDTGADQSIVPLHRGQPPTRSRGAGGPEHPDRGGRSATTDADGLPKRTRRANLAPQLRREAAEERPVPLAAQRSPDEIRSMMSSFQSNFGRGLADGQDSNDGDDVGKVT